MEKHKEALDKLCRVCGCSLRKSKTKYSASNNTELLSVVGIHSTTDNPDVHPAIFCHMCYTTLKRKQVATELGKPFATTLQVYAWLPHTDDSCSTCTRLGEVGRRGKPPRKNTYSGCMPTDSQNHQTHSRSSSCFLSSHKQRFGVSFASFCGHIFHTRRSRVFSKHIRRLINW